MFSDETNVRALLQKVLGYSQADQTEVVYLGTESALTRFANNSIHQNVAESNHQLRVRAVAGKRVGVATTNRLDDESLRRVTEQALHIARLQPENPEFHSLPGPQPIVPAPGYSELTARFSPEERAQRVGIIVQLARERGRVARGHSRSARSQSRSDDCRRAPALPVSSGHRRAGRWSVDPLASDAARSIARSTEDRQLRRGGLQAR